VSHSLAAPTLRRHRTSTLEIAYEESGAPEKVVEAVIELAARP
jgi:hypothetical protein